MEISALDHRVVTAAQRFAERMTDIDRRLRQAHQTIPSRAVKDEAAAAFWSFVETASSAVANEGVTPDVEPLCRVIAGAWLFRSRLWNRAYHKPHGFPGDYLLYEWLYDLEVDPCADPTQPGIVNCLDYLMRTLHSVAGVWERRRWFASLLEAEHTRRNRGPLSVLDLGCGGARHLWDFLTRLPRSAAIDVTLVDQDPAALAYCRQRATLDAPNSSGVQLLYVCGQLPDLPRLLGPTRYDVIIAADLLDYLDDLSAAALLRDLAARLAPRGLIALANVHPADPSRLAKDWLVDWSPVVRDERQCAALFPRTLSVETGRTENHALSFATARARI